LETGASSFVVLSLAVTLVRWYDRLESTFIDVGLWVATNLTCFQIHILVSGSNILIQHYFRTINNVVVGISVIHLNLLSRSTTSWTPP